MMCRSLLGITKLVCKQFGRKGLALVCIDEEVGQVRLDFKADATFKELKKMLATAPILASPLPKEPMFLYIAATKPGGKSHGRGGKRRGRAKL
jgi:hypothetical protein